MDFVDCYDLDPCRVRPEQLMLDPSNPRISLAMESKAEYSNQEICSEELQAFVENKVLDGHHQVAGLIDDIRNQGFVRGSQPIIVKKIHKEKYLVLEGNRRTVAIRNLLRTKESLSPEVVRSLETVPVEILKYKQNSRYSEAQVIDIFLGVIHLKGTEDWGPMEKACYVYRTYLREVEGEHDSNRFHYDAAIAKEVGKQFSLKPAEVKLEIGVYRVYEQLKKQGYDIKPEGYTLIQLALKTPASKEYFEYSSDALKMSVDGLDAYAQACVEEGASITNPKKWGAFAYVLKEGTAHEQRQVVEGRDPEQIKALVEGQRQQQLFCDTLVAIKKNIEKLRIYEFNGSDEEISHLSDISILFKTFLAPLLEEESANELPNQDANQQVVGQIADECSSFQPSQPTTFDAVFALSEVELRWWIEKLYEDHPEGIISNRIPSLLLREWEIQTKNRGERRIFKDKVDQIIYKLEKEGFFDY